MYFNMKNKMKNLKNKKPKNIFQKLGGQLITVILILVLILVFSSSSKVKKENEITLSQLAQKINSGQIKEIKVELGDLKITDINKKELFSKKENESSLTESLKNLGVKSEILDSVNIKIQDPSSMGYYFAAIFPYLLPILFIALILMFLTKQKGGAMQALSFGDSKAKFIDPNDKKNRKTFKDIAGAKEAKQELMEVVDFLKHPKKYLEIGAEIPKGVLMTGAPGTGKTLLARAVAGEAGVPFFSISGSEFIEMFVGVGASRVRDLFKNAKKMSPAIIFIDEIDAIGRTRGGGMGGGNDEREQTLNQILVEMDGFDDQNKVIVIAATNRPEILDKALLRPGRFDRRVVIDLPDKEDREKILEIHGKKKPFAEDVDLKLIAERTPGFSGADLYSLMNEGAILAASEERKKVSQYDLIRSIEKVMLGPERKSHILGDEEKLRTAYHEVGHALVSSVLDYADPVHKVTIISRGRAAGYTLHLPFDDKKMNTKKDFEADIAVSLGGYIAEKIIFGDVTTGPSNDLQVSTRIARDMVVKYGMSEKVGVLALESGESTLAGSGDGLQKNNYSAKTSELVDEEVRRIMEDGFKTAKKILTKHEDALHGISEVLKEKEVLERDDYEALLKDFKIKVRTHEDQKKLFKVKKKK